MKEDLFDDIISTDVSEEINDLFTGIYDIDDLKLYLYLETNNDIFKKTEIYDIKSDVKFFIFYPVSNQILVTTGFFKLSESDKVDILKKYVLDKEKYIGNSKYVLDKEKYIGNIEFKEDVVPYSYNDICKKIIEIIDNSTISRSYKYKVINYIDYSTPDINKIYANITFGRDTLYWFNLINDDILINVIMHMMDPIFLSLPKTTEGKLRRAIAKINEKNKK